MQQILIPQTYGDVLASIREYANCISEGKEGPVIVFEPNADRRAVMEFEQNLQTYGLLDKCERCQNLCIQYSAPNLHFYCADFKGRR